MKVKMILPALTEALSPYWRPIKYSLFPPLGLATLAGYMRDNGDEVTIQDEHVEALDLSDEPDLVVIQVYITSAYRAYELANHYRAKGAHVALGGLHVTSLPEEAAGHADTIFLGPGEDTWPAFLADYRAGRPGKVYQSQARSLVGTPRVRRDLIKRHLYLVPNSIVVSRGCPHACDFCYKEAFFAGGKSFYTQTVDDALAEIERLPGRHLYFLDDHLFGHSRFAAALFEGMRGMGRLWQAAATVQSVLRPGLLEKAAESGLRSLFVGFETLNPDNLRAQSKHQNLSIDYNVAIRRLHDLGVMINASFVFGMDDDDETVFDRTVAWAVEAGIDIILMPPAEHLAVEALRRALSSGQISEERLDRSVRKILAVKEALGLNRSRAVSIEEIPRRVATAAHRLLAKEIARRSLTVLTNEGDILPLQLSGYRHPLLLVLNDADDNRLDIHRPGPRFTTEPAGDYFARLLSLRNGEIRTLRLGPGCGNDQLDAALEAASEADLVLLALHVRVRTSSGRIGMPERFRSLLDRLHDVRAPLVAVSFGTPYIMDKLDDARALVCAYGDAEPLVEASAEALLGEIPVGGRLPVSIGTRFGAGSGLSIPQSTLRHELPGLTGYDARALLEIDRTVRAAIRDSAFPGAQLAVGVEGRLVYTKTFGTMTYGPESAAITQNSLFDLASLTKVFATTAAAMMLVEKGEIELDDPVGDYLPAFDEGEKAAITIRHLLTHTSGFPPFRRFFLFCSNASEALDSIYATPLVATPGDTTIYSDLGMITMGKVVEQVSGLGLDEYLRQEFYLPLGMASTMFRPPASLAERIVPTEYDSLWRHALVRGVVHDENAALLGGVAGHAGLFSTASDLAVFVQMLLNEGVYAGHRYLSSGTIRQFIGSRPEQRRFLGWDFRSPVGSSSGSLFSARAFGHTGFTGTSVWVDPERRLFVVFLTNRVHPTRANRRIYDVRPTVHDTIIRSLNPVQLPQ